MGTYDNQTELVKNGRKVGIDNCILKEIQHLWSLGITTVESCCGHNICDGYIAVIEDDILKMNTLGYITDHPDITRKDCFLPKTESP